MPSEFCPGGPGRAVNKALTPLSASADWLVSSSINCVTRQAQARLFRSCLRPMPVRFHSREKTPNLGVLSLLLRMNRNSGCIGLRHPSAGQSRHISQVPS